MDSVLDSVRGGDVGPADAVPARPPVASFVVTDDQAPTPGLVSRLLAPPHWRFHLLCGLGAAGVIWAAASPMSATIPTGAFTWLAAVCVAVWALRLLVGSFRGTLTLGYAVVPALALALGGLIYLDTPQQARWFHAADEFEQTLRALPMTNLWDQAAADAMTPARIGTYPIDGVSRGSAGNVQFRLDGGAAFTYLVEGVSAEIRDANPGASFEHVSGNWYVLRPAG